MAPQIMFVTIVAAVTANFASAGVVPAVPAAPVLAKIEDFDAAPQYSFAYDVQDAITGDSKAQYETRNGDVVQGSYSLIEADGTRRIVDYTADPVNGFNAVVNREPAVVAAPVVKSVAPVVSSPVVVKSAIPAAPVVAAPVAARTVVPGVPVARAAVPVVSRAFAAPLVASNVVAPAAAPVVGYTVPRAVATRLSAPVYSAPLNYAVAPTTLL